MESKRCFVLTLLALTLSAARVWAYPLPAPPDAPSSFTNFPGTFDPFTPPADLAPVDPAAPTFAEWTRTAGAGDTLVLTGTRFSSVGNGRDTRFLVFAQSLTTQLVAEAAIQRLSGEQVAITLPTALPAWSTYFIWPFNRLGAGIPAVVNQTDAWWLGPDLATRGETVSVFGRNLTHTNGTTLAWLYLENAAGTAGRWLAATSANPCKVDVELPADLANGAYRIWAHNGHGGSYGWSGPLTLAIDDGISWTATQLDIRTYGATANDNTDDLAAFRAALDAARASPGATVYVPTGVFLISNSITNVAPHTRLRGDGMNLSFIRATTNFSHGYYAMVTGAFDRVEMRDLSIDTAGHVENHRYNMVVDASGSRRTRFVNVRFDQSKDIQQAAPVDVQGSELVSFRGCEFLESGGIFLGAARQVSLDHCALRGINDNIAMIYHWGASEVSIVNCTAADYDNADPDSAQGWAQGRVLGGAGIWGAARHLYFGGNQTMDLTVRPAFWNQNTGEQFMFEAMETIYRGQVIAATPTTVRLPALAGDCSNQIAVVVGGTGLGQCRDIASANLLTGTLTLTRPWNLAPDAASTLAIGHYLSRAAVYGNTFDGKPRAVTNQDAIACSGVEPFGGCLELIVAANTFHELRTGIATFSVPNVLAGQLITQPSFFNYYADNHFERCRIALGAWVDRYDELPITYDVCMLGNVIRNNTLDDVRDTAFPFYTRDSVTSMFMGAYEGNRGTNVLRVANMYPAALRDQIWVNNQFHGTGADDGIVLNTNALPAMRHNTLEGFRNACGGSPPGAILETPHRTASLPDGITTGEMAIWNSGTSPMGWTGTSSVAWLTLDNAGGTIPDQDSAAVVPFTINTSGLTAGAHEALITIASPGQSQQVTVAFSIPFFESSAPTGTVFRFTAVEHASPALRVQSRLN